eukprot:gnl/Chilomastix_caulleri/421.p1 GENE.gnl/Chilomastix_caulleri/421~~gnl/Chilomastix_caulleri/421.p1  ORF type:complete len:253 (+),score=78.19 gnl/Chilomastix_caulleri/421:98-856(+)
MYSDTIAESSNLFKIEKARGEIKGARKMSGQCSVNVNTADFTMIDSLTGEKFIVPYKYITKPETVLPSSGADGYKGVLRLPDGKRVDFKVTFPGGEFRKFISAVVPGVVGARNSAAIDKRSGKSSNPTPQPTPISAPPSNPSGMYVPIPQPGVPMAPSGYPQQQQQQYPVPSPYYNPYPSAPQPMPQIQYGQGGQMYGAIQPVQMMSMEMEQPQISYPQFTVPLTASQSTSPTDNPYMVPGVPQIPDYFGRE